MLIAFQIKLQTISNYEQTAIQQVCCAKLAIIFTFQMQLLQ